MAGFFDVNLLLRFPYVFYLAFLVVFISPLNEKPPKLEYRVIQVKVWWRTVVYFGGIVMGFGYAAAGVVAAVDKTFTKGCIDEPSTPYLQQYVYTTLLPVGLLMGIFHIFMARDRLAGSTIANGPIILACSLVQCVWLAIWSVWMVKSVQLCGFSSSPCATAVFVLTLVSSGIIALIMFLRLIIFTISGCDRDTFDEAYCGGSEEISGDDQARELVSTVAIEEGNESEGEEEVGLCEKLLDVFFLSEHTIDTGGNDGEPKNSSPVVCAQCPCVTFMSWCCESPRYLWQTLLNVGTIVFVLYVYWGLQLGHHPGFSPRCAITVTWSAIAVYTLIQFCYRGTGRKISYDFLGLPDFERNKLLVRKAWATGWLVEADYPTPELRRATWRWLYWLSGLVVGACLIAAGLPPLLMRGHDAWSADHFRRMQLCKVIAGFMLLNKECILTEAHTISASKVVEERGITDSWWGMMTRLCQISMIFVIAWLSWDLWYLNLEGSSRANWAGDWDYLEAHPLVFNQMRICQAICLGIIIPIFVMRFLMHYCAGGTHKYLWIIRKKNQPWNDPVQKDSVLDPVFSVIAPSRLMDRMMLEKRLARRFNDRCFRDWAAANRLGYNNIGDLFDIINDVLMHPKMDAVDNHTKVFVYFVKVIVEGGRKEPIMPDEIGKPLRKQYDEDGNGTLTCWESPVAGLQFALSDEHYCVANDGEIVTEATAFSKMNEIVLGLHTRLPVSDSPRWFDTELEGVITYEALFEPFAPDPNGHWEDLVSDSAFTLLAFNGVGQHFLVGRNAAEVQGTISKYRVPADAMYLIDMTALSKYDVRERFAKYGAIACFDKQRKLVHIYVSHWGVWLRAPTETSPDRDQQRWAHAKFVVKASMGTYMTLKDHLMYCHWIVSNTASICLRKSLERWHPVRRLMHMFVFRSPSVNIAACKTLMPEDLYVHRAAAFEYEGIAEAFEDVAKAWKFETFPEFVSSKKLGDVEGQLPMVQDGKALWDIFRGFVSVFLSIYYRSSEEVARDPEIQELWAAVNSMPSGPEEKRQHGGIAPGYGYKLPPLTSGKGAFDNLCDYLAHVMFWATGVHELVGAVIEYFQSPAGLSTKIFDETCPENNLLSGGQTMSDVQTFLQDLSIISTTGYRQPALVTQWQRMLHLQEDDVDDFEGKFRFELQRPQLAQVHQYLDNVPYFSSHEIALGHSAVARKKNDEGVAVSPGVRPSAQKEQEALYGNELRVLLSNLGRSHSIEDHNQLMTRMHHAFIIKLLNLSEKIVDLNKTRDQPFSVFDPMNLECSVSI